MEDAIKIYLPVTISYPALEGVLKSQLVGEYFPKSEEGAEAAPYVQVQDLGISGSRAAANEVIVRIKLRILRTVMKRDQVELFVLAALGYDNETQQLYVQQFKLDSRTSSGFYNTALEVMVNKVAYGQILKMARVDLAAIIAEQLVKANTTLQDGLEIKGIKLLGEVKSVRVLNVVPFPDKVALSVELHGNMEANVLNLAELLPEK